MEHIKQPVVEGVATQETQIHPTAIVDRRARLEEGVIIGPYCIVKGDVEIDTGTVIYSHALVDDGARVGKNVQVHHGAVVSGRPQDLKYNDEPTYLYIGDGTVIREFATLHRGTIDRGKTVVGKNCLFMAYSHIAHDCYVGDHVILANSVNIGGHVTIQDWAIVGGVVPVHQFVRIGCHSIIGGGFRVPMDVVPYALAGGYPLKIEGLNRVGLQRRGFSEKTVSILRQTYRLLFQSKLNTTQALEQIKTKIEMIPEVKNIIEFIETSERGIVK